MCLLYRKLDARSVPTYAFRNITDFFNSKILELGVDQAYALVKSGVVINAWTHSTIIQSHNWLEKGPKAKVPYTLTTGERSNAVILLRDSRVANMIIMIDMRGEASILTLSACRKLVENNLVYVLNMPTRGDKRPTVVVKYIPVI